MSLFKRVFKTKFATKLSGFNRLHFLIFPSFALSISISSFHRKYNIIVIIFLFFFFVFFFFFFSSSSSSSSTGSLQILLLYFLLRIYLFRMLGRADGKLFINVSNNVYIFIYLFIHLFTKFASSKEHLNMFRTNKF